MGAKDITEKSLEGYNDVFSDIVNVLLFNGEEVIHSDDLAEPSFHQTVMVTAILLFRLFYTMGTGIDGEKPEHFMNVSEYRNSSKNMCLTME